MIPRATIQKILEAGAKAPSGSNSQPWKFEIRGDEITVIALPEKDHPVLNFRHRGTWIAHGALIENMAVAAREFGCVPHIRLFPDRENKTITAKIVLEQGQAKGDYLYPAIALRTTNRKKYETAALPQDERRALLEVAEQWKEGDVRAVFVEDPQAIGKLGEAASVNEIVMFENKALHKLLFEEIVWTKTEEVRRGRGLLFGAMELAPPALVVKAFGFWPLMKILNTLGAARKIGKSNAKMYAATPMICAILAGDADGDFLNAGRLMERIWLQAALFGLGAHLMTGVLFLEQRIASGETSLFSREHIRLIREAYKETAALTGAGDRTVALLFRIGKGGEPTARSTKNFPVAVFQ